MSGRNALKTAGRPLLNKGDLPDTHALVTHRNDNWATHIGYRDGWPGYILLCGMAIHDPEWLPVDTSSWVCLLCAKSARKKGLINV